MTGDIITGKIYGYIRVSSDKQTVENQRFEINNFCKKNGIKIDQWIEETVSGTVKANKRKLGPLLTKLAKGDLMIASELSRLGRNLMQIMSILNVIMEKEARIWTIKDNYRLGDDISSKVLAFAFGLSAEIERNLISQRTKEALARKRAEGVILGRPKGSKSRSVKLTGQEDKIKELLNAGVSKSAIGRMLKVHRLTVSAFVDDNKLEQEDPNIRFMRIDMDKVVIIKMHEEGDSIRRIADSYDVSEHAIRTRLKKWDVI